MGCVVTEPGIALQILGELSAKKIDLVNKRVVFRGDYEEQCFLITWNLIGI